MSNYTFTIKDVLRSLSPIDNQDFWNVPLPADLVDKTYDKFFNFDPIKEWQVVINPNKEANEQAIAEAKNNLAVANLELVQLNGMLDELNARLKQAVMDQQIAATTPFVATPTATWQIIKIDIAKVTTAINVCNANLKILTDLVTAAQAKADTDAKDVSQENAATLTAFEKTFLIHFFDAESKYDTIGLLKLRLMSWWREYIPVYSQLMQKQTTDLFITSSHNNNNKSQNQSKNTQRNADASWSIADQKTTDATTTHEGVLDTPQTELDLDLSQLKYASQVRSTDTTDLATNNQTGANYSEGQNDGQSTTTDTSDNVSKGRDGDIFTMIDEWSKSNYSTYLDIFDKLDKHLFLQLF